MKPAKVPSGDSIDCWDDSASVHPGAAAYHTSEIAGRDPSVDFDYNCDTREEPKLYQENAARLECRGLVVDPGPIIVNPPVLEPLAVGCTGTAGWAGTAPKACGDEGKWSTCKTVAGTCSRVSDSTKILDCR